jgi:hypothetical protein
MYQLLKEGPLPNRGEQTLPEFRRIRDGLRASVERVIEYHRSNPMAVANGHILLKLLMSLNVPITLEPEIYNDKVRDVALYVAKALRMTTPLAEGVAFSPGPFYGDHVTEVLWAHMDDYDTSLLRTSWRTLEPVRVLYHPKTDLALDVPDGKRDSLEAGMAVIAINVPMLASQYRMWRAEQRETNTEQQRSMMQFLMEVPLPRMLPSHLDIAVMNRLIGRFFEVEMPVHKPHHQFALFDWVPEVDRVLDRTLAFMQGRAMSFDAIISQIPTVYAHDLHERLHLPDMAFVRQVQWAVVVSRLALTTFLVQFNARTHNSANQQYLNYLDRYLRQMDMSGVLQSALSRQRYEDVRTLIEIGIEPYV